MADGGTATEDDCRGIWLFRHLLPPVGDGENLLVSLRQLGSTLAVVGKGRSLHLDGSIDLGFDVRVESAAVAIDAATSCEVQSASHHGEPYEVRITCTAPTRVEAPIGAALGDGFSVVARRGDTTFWRVDFGRPDRKASATTALIEALGSSEQEPAPAELSAAYKRLTSPFERLMVWRGGHGGDDEAAMLQRAQRYDLLRGVLRGPNPEGRALAAVALREAGAFTPDDRRVLQILAKATLAIRVAAEDDMAGQWPSSKFFSQPRWPVRSDFRSL